MGLFSGIIDDLFGGGSDESDSMKEANRLMEEQLRRSKKRLQEQKEKLYNKKLSVLHANAGPDWESGVTPYDESSGDSKNNSSSNSGLFPSRISE